VVRQPPGRPRFFLELTGSRAFPPDLDLQVEVRLGPRELWSLAALPHHRTRAMAIGLLLAWGLLTVSLPLAPQGRLLFWNTVIPLLILLLAISGHEFWRRVCPLALLSRWPQRLWPWGLGRSPGNPRRLAPQSWLARHHLSLQGLLLLLGLALRLQLVNHHAPSLALLFVVTMVAALVCGALLPGKAWCQYLCPMGPVEAIITGPRGLLGSRSHRQPPDRLSQSTCRSLLPDGREINACVHCQTPCIDIDSEQTYWQSLAPHDPFTRLTWMYPGLVGAFFMLMASGPALRAFALPVLLAGSMASGLGFALLHRLGLSRHRSRLLAAALAVTVFVSCTDATVGIAGPGGTLLLRVVGLVGVALWLRREWSRRLQHHSRERVLQGLRSMLQKHLPKLVQGDPAGPAPHAALPAVLAWMALQPPDLQREISPPLLRGLINDLRRMPHLDFAVVVTRLLTLHRALGQTPPAQEDLLQRLRGSSGP